METDSFRRFLVRPEYKDAIKALMENQDPVVDKTPTVENKLDKSALAASLRTAEADAQGIVLPESPLQQGRPENLDHVGTIPLVLSLSQPPLNPFTAENDGLDSSDDDC